MQILAFYPYVPFPLDRGAYYRGFHLLRELARAHDVDLLALSEDGQGTCEAAVFQEFCRNVDFVRFRHPEWEKLLPTRLLNRLPATVAHWTLPEVGASVERLIRTRRYDSIHIFDSILAQYVLRQDPALPVVIDRTRVDLQYQLMERRWLQTRLRRRILDFENLMKLWSYERRIASRTKLQIVCGPDDAQFLRRWVSRSLRLAVIPNGVDTEYFTPAGTRTEAPSMEPTILFCGAMDYNPNIDALRWYFGNMHGKLVENVPGLRVWLVGKEPGEEVRKYGRLANVMVTGSVPDVRPYYRRAWLQIVPLRIGGGTRLKIVESMAIGTPVISTTIGAQGLGLTHGQDILLADSASDFVRTTLEALRNPELRQCVREAGLATVRARLAWPTLGKELTEVYARSFGLPPNSPHRDDSIPVATGGCRALV